MKRLEAIDLNKKKTGGMYIFWSAAIVLCLLLVLFSLLFSSCSDGGPRPSDPPEQTGEPAPPDDPNNSADPGQVTAPPAETQQPNLPSAELLETSDAGQEYVDKLIFLGDSTTNGLKYYGVLSDGTATTQVWVPASATLALFNQSIATIVYPETGEEITIAAAVEAKQPEYLVITLGVNGVATMDEDYFKSEYGALVQSIQAASPDTKIILNAIYPVMTEYSNKDNGISNEKIRAANMWIRDVAASNNVKFLNAASAVTGEDGSLPNEYCNDGQLHLNAEGFNKVLAYIRTHAYL